MSSKIPLEPVMPVYRVGRAGCRIFMKVMYKMWVLGTSNIPNQGACILACNHQSNLDPPLMGASVSHRQVWFMAKKELLQTPLLGKFLQGCGCFWVDRKAKDGKAVEQGVELLKKGKVVGIFPEGTRSRDGKLKPGRSGVALMALKAGVPIVPAAVYNTREVEKGKFMPFGKSVGIRFGKPILIPKEEEPSLERIREVKDLVMAAIAELIEQGPKRKDE